MNVRGDPQRAQTLLQRCSWLGATDDSVARHVGALTSLSLEPRPYSFISAPNDFAELSSIERHWVENELVGHPARIEHYQVCPEVRRLVNDTAFEGVFVNHNEGERALIPWFNIRKRRRHSKAPSHSSSTCSSACNLWGKSLTKHKVNQLRCEHFPVGDMVHHAAGTTSMRSHELAAAETLLRETCVALIRILETHTMERPDDRS